MQARPAARCSRRRQPKPSVAGDVILSLDWLDIAGTLKNAGGNVTAKFVQVSVDHRLHNGWSMDYQGLPPVDVIIDCEPDVAVPALLAALGPAKPHLAPTRREGIPSRPATSSPSIISP